MLLMLLYSDCIMSLQISPHVARSINVDFQSESAAVKPDTVARLYGNAARLQRHQRNSVLRGSAAEAAHFPTQQGWNIGLTHRCCCCCCYAAV